MAERLSWRQVCARRLDRHGLSVPLPGAGPAEVVGALAAAHAQVMSAAELSVGLRLAGATRADVRRALWDEHTLVKTFGPRGTVHLVRTEDLPMWTGALSGLPAAPGRQPDGVRLAPDQADEIIVAIGAVLAGAELTVDELTEALAAEVGPWAAAPVMPAWQEMWPRWRQLTATAAHRGALCFGPHRGRKVTYTSPRRWLPGLRPGSPDATHRGLLLRYLHSYGPSTPARFANWLAAPARWAAGIFDSMAGELELVEVEGGEAWVAKGDAAAPPDPPRGVRLLPYFDSYAYRVGNHADLLYSEAARARGLKNNFQLLIIDGVVAGLWHQRRSGRRLQITVEPLEPLTSGQRRRLDEQVERVGHILEGTPHLTIGTITTGSHP